MRQTGGGGRRSTGSVTRRVAFGGARAYQVSIAGAWEAEDPVPWTVANGTPRDDVRGPLLAFLDGIRA